MRIFLLFKEIYEGAFRGIGGNPTVPIMKSIAWLCFLCILTVLYAFVYRMVTGFTF
ncbi:DUF6747 family protein [Leptobacterium sp. I13]|uniref:DUF6747 family protein n=1 Tax=Leptobacterium meishanense TaxID=3128904 RepID=UPI0030ED9EB4